MEDVFKPQYSIYNWQKILLVPAATATTNIVIFNCAARCIVEFVSVQIPRLGVAPTLGVGCVVYTNNLYLIRNWQQQTVATSGETANLATLVCSIPIEFNDRINIQYANPSAAAVQMVFSLSVLGNGTIVP